jgi:hypothetical protein
MTNTLVLVKVFVAKAIGNDALLRDHAFVLDSATKKRVEPRMAVPIFDSETIGHALFAPLYPLGPLLSE